MSDSKINLPAAMLFTMRAETNGGRKVAGLPLGDRVIIDITGGEFHGDRLSGRLLASGGDWVALTPAGPMLDVRLVMETHDGTIVLFRYSGLAVQESGGVRARVAGRFEAPAGEYGWLNAVHAVGFGESEAGVAKYTFYQLL